VKIYTHRIRTLQGGFSYIPHRFLTDGFLASLSQKEILLYFFLVLASDRHGLSFYSYDAICSFLQLSVDQYVEARDGLLKKDLIAFDGPPSSRCLNFLLDLEPYSKGRSELKDPIGESLRRIKGG
jgi:hypothetical protein